MLSVFIDESGDLGTKTGSSATFLVVAIATRNVSALFKAVGKVAKAQSAKTLHAHKMSARNRIKLLESLVKLDITIATKLIIKAVRLQPLKQQDIYYDLKNKALSSVLNKAHYNSKHEQLEITMSQRDTKRVLNEKLLETLCMPQGLMHGSQ